MELRHVNDFTKVIRVGISGTGFIATGLFEMLQQHSDYRVEKLLSRRSTLGFSEHRLAQWITNDIHDLVDACDVIIECSGDALWAAKVVDEAFKANRPVLTMNAEFQLLAGTYFESRGLLHESEGDQPGSLAALEREVRLMGFTPVVYGAQKSFLDPQPNKESMRYWADYNNQSLANTVSFTDGTKIQIETALVANGLGADMLKPGLLGVSCASTRDGALTLAQHAKSAGKMIADYVLNSGGQGEIFIVAEHDTMHQDALAYFKMGQGPFYYISRPYHLGYVEILKSLENILAGSIKPFNNGTNPTKSVAAIAKRTLRPGSQISHGIGSFDVRGEVVHIKDVPTHMPIALLREAEVRRFVEPGEMLAFADLDIPDSLAASAWRFTRDRALANSVRAKKEPAISGPA